MKRTAAGSLAIMAALCGALAPGNAQATPKSSEFGTLSGIVKAPAGAGLSGVCVLAVPVDTTAYPRPVTTDGAGRFSISVDLLHVSGSIGPHGYQVRFTLCGTKSDVAPEWWKHANDVADSTNVVVYPGRRTTMKVGLQAGADVLGQVRLAPGLPLAGICVATVNLDNTTVEAKTDSAGNYRLSNLVPGLHDISVMSSCTNGVALGSAVMQSSAGTHNIASSALVTLKAGQKLQRVDFTAST